MAATGSLSPSAKEIQGQQKKPQLKLRGKPAENPSFAYVFVLDYRLLAKAQEQKQQQQREPHPWDSEWARADNSNTYDFNYEVSADVTIPALLETLDDYAGALHDGLSDEIKMNIPIVLVGWGYGGLICEKTALMASDTIDIFGIVLLGTPHKSKGLKRWATLYTADKGKTPHKDEYDDVIKQVSVLSEIQDKFRKRFVEGDKKIKVACCFAGKSESGSNASQAVPPDLCVLPGSWVAEIDATYSQMTGFPGESVKFTNIAGEVQEWHKRRGAKLLDFNRRSVYKSSLPLIRVKSPDGAMSDDVKVGVVVTSTSIQDMNVLATAAEVEDAMAKLSQRRTDAPGTDGRSAGEATQVEADRQGIAPLDDPRAKKYAEGAVWVDKVKTQLKNHQLAYLVVRTIMATGTEGQAPESPRQQVKGVDLLPIRVAPSRRSSAADSLARVAASPS